MKIYFCEIFWKILIKDVISKWYPYKKYKEEHLTSFIKNTRVLEILSLTETRKKLKELYPGELQKIFADREKEFLIGKKIYLYSTRCY
ncbi:unnamed protein product [Commensalibacter communis]|uniref:Uncharacterized protein n=1 Tax=Commensalibacter communis TaxID=2972786 RepID=A0A9W4X6H6_9PROT|nr:unnamed protein product [Commensalibacter communis]CAI3938938.1 unnamed protein product [Commensalibacter communis]CAI3941224.1 unnamed protein product [Commensalibacter communis]CAI3941406.1 unnamed protein product [Commensalibacter communis]CAI3944559.1 unnamed protein product [Commensalibacter communis]